MVDTDERWRGEVTAKLEMLLGTVNAISVRQERLADSVALTAGLIGRVAAVEVAQTSLVAEVSGLKATARAWGVFAGILSGFVSYLVGRLWK